MVRKLIIGTVEEAIEIEEYLLGRKLPRPFRLWLLDNNGADLHDIRIYPVRDERDTRKTWESLAYNLQHEWAEKTSRFHDKIFAHLLPFADYGIGDYYCFDYSAEDKNGEQPVVLWSHTTGKTEFYAADFNEFKARLSAVALEQDI